MEHPQEKKAMSLIDRYIHEVGRHLPRKNRSDIQVELRSLVVDALEDRAGDEPTDEEIADLLKEFGPPKKVAASYYPEGQHLIGPALYPLFRMVVGIALAAVIGAQLLAYGVVYFIAQEPIAILESFSSLINSIPAVFGMVVIVFAVLQWFEVRPDTVDEPWDPSKLPQISVDEDVKRGERIFSIVISILILGVLFFFPDKVGFITTPGGEFFANPVITQYIGWISISLLIGIGLDIYLLWQGRWSTATRIVKIAANLLSIAILLLLVQGHSAWLAERGAGSLFSSLERLADDVASSWQMIGMQAFRLGFSVALIVIIIETVVMLFRLVKINLRRDLSPDTIPSLKI
jgi:hypothetical protein